MCAQVGNHRELIMVNQQSTNANLGELRPTDWGCRKEIPQVTRSPRCGSFDWEFENNFDSYFG